MRSHIKKDMTAIGADGAIIGERSDGGHFRGRSFS